MAVTRMEASPGQSNEQTALLHPPPIATVSAVIDAENQLPNGGTTEREEVIDSQQKSTSVGTVVSMLLIGMFPVCALSH